MQAVLGVPTNASSQAASIAANATGSAAATLLLDTLQTAIKPEGVQILAPARQHGQQASSNSGTLASATQLFVTTLRHVERVAVAATAALNATQAPPEDRAAAVVAAMKLLISSILKDVAVVTSSKIAGLIANYPGRIPMVPIANPGTQRLLSKAPGLQ